MPKRKVLAVTPPDLKKGVEPDPNVDGVFGGVRFRRGVSETISYQRARQFAARGNAVLPVDEADRRVREIRGQDEKEGSPSEAPSSEVQREEEPPPGAEEEGAARTPDPLQRLTPATLEGASLPKEVDVPSYHDMLSELSEEGIGIHDFFGGQPSKEPLTKLYFAYQEGVDALLNEPG